MQSGTRETPNDNSSHISGGEIMDPLPREGNPGLVSFFCSLFFLFCLFTKDYINSCYFRWQVMSVLVILASVSFTIFFLRTANHLRKLHYVKI